MYTKDPCLPDSVGRSVPFAAGEPSATSSQVTLIRQRHCRCSQPKVHHTARLLVWAVAGMVFVCLFVCFTISQLWRRFREFGRPSNRVWARQPRSPTSNTLASEVVWDQDPAQLLPQWVCTTTEVPLCVRTRLREADLHARCAHRGLGPAALELSWTTTACVACVGVSGLLLASVARGGGGVSLLLGCIYEPKSRKSWWVYWVNTWSGTFVPSYDLWPSSRVCACVCVCAQKQGKPKMVKTSFYYKLLRCCKHDYLTCNTK